MVVRAYLSLMAKYQSCMDAFVMASKREKGSSKSTRSLVKRLLEEIAIKWLCPENGEGIVFLVEHRKYKLFINGYCKTVF